MSLRARLQLYSVAAVVVVVLFILFFDETATFTALAAPAGLATIALLVISIPAARSLTASVENLTEVARSLASGDLTVRPPLNAPGEIGDLATAIARLSEHLGSRTAALKHEDAMLASVIEALDEGVVYVDARRQVTRINTAAKEILGLGQHVPYSADRLPRARELQQGLDAALRGIIADPVETTISGRTVSLSARPLALGGGVVLALFDLTHIRRLETVRRDFVANVSHELRTPLTVITGFAETLADDDPPPELRRQFAGTIRAHASRMQRIVDDLLDLSRLEAGKWDPVVEKLDVRSIADEVLTTFAATARQKGLTLDISIETSADSIDADVTAVRHVLSNLVDNALRHTERGSVTIFSENERGGTWIGVRDTGLGIEREHLSRIFERFYRVDSGRARHAGGTGLGLAIVKHLVETHGGRVRADSQPGQGTTIAALFPRHLDTELTRPASSLQPPAAG